MLPAVPPDTAAASAGTQGTDDPTTCPKAGCQGGHVAGKCTGHASDSSGRPCKNWPVHGTRVCKFHGAGAPQVRAAAQMRILESADAVAAALVKIALDDDQPGSVRVQAQKDLLDRAGLGAKQLVDVTHRDLRDPDELAAATAELEDELDEFRRRKLTGTG